jgi:hypothetical protein
MTTRLPDEHVVDGLYWSKRGEIACAAHAPERGSERWDGEQWSEITAMASANPHYQCRTVTGRRFIAACPGAKMSSGW